MTVVAGYFHRASKAYFATRDDEMQNRGGRINGMVFNEISKKAVRACMSCKFFGDTLTFQ